MNIELAVCAEARSSRETERGKGKERIMWKSGRTFEVDGWTSVLRNCWMYIVVPGNMPFPRVQDESKIDTF